MGKNQPIPASENDNYRDQPNQYIDPYLDETSSIPGWPGYRTRPGRSGLDYLDNQYEFAHMVGRFLHYLFTGKLRTRNPFYLFWMALTGLFCLFLIGLIFVEYLLGGRLYFGIWIYAVPTGILGFALLLNLIKNMRNR
jgi:hypothetical protein